MGCCNEPAFALSSSAPDPARHVNYAKGMVLGVDDFTQEFAYLAGRDQWLARDAIGYGTLSGLSVTQDGSADDPRLHVTAGSALAVSGKLICVPADQCCLLNKWLAKPENATTVTQLLGGSPPLSPPLSPRTISLYLTLCYADCLTAPVPIPGEPCRSEDQLMAASRVADDFCLELRSKAPPQVEEDALRDFVKWLKHNVQIVDASPPPAGDDASWLETLQSAAQTWSDAMKASPPLSPPASIATLGDFLADLSPPNLSVSREQLDAFLRVAFRFWVTELRPMWTARRCHAPVNSDQDCVLLARVEFPVLWEDGSPTGAWRVDGGASPVRIDETTRPVLAHLRLIQEWLLCGLVSETAGVSSPALGLPPASSPPDSPMASPPAPDAPVDAKYVLLESNPQLSSAQSLGGLATGLLKNTVAVATGTGALSTAQEGTDYYQPGGTDVQVVDGGTGLSGLPLDGQLLIGNGAGYVLSQVAGTANQITVANGPGSIRLSLPQDIALPSTPQFGGLTTTGRVNIQIELVTAPTPLTPLKLGDQHHCVVCIAPMTVALPLCSGSKGRVYIIKNAVREVRGTITLVAATPDSIDGPASLPKGKCATLISDGKNTWHLIATV